jgi:hypothetical protein
MGKAVTDTKLTEVKERAGRILAKFATADAGEYSADEARELRAVWALELSSTAEAKELLESWAKAKVRNRLSEASVAALKRMKRNYSKKNRRAGLFQGNRIQNANNLRGDLARGMEMETGRCDVER